MSTKRPRCSGILGLIFGHQYVKSRGGWIYRDEFCFRCGMEQGR